MTFKDDIILKTLFNGEKVHYFGLRAISEVGVRILEKVRTESKNLINWNGGQQKYNLSPEYPDNPYSWFNSWFNSRF